MYLDRFRDVFLEMILWFIRAAGREEIAAIRMGVQKRAKYLRIGGKKGRPRAMDDERLLSEAKGIAWQRVVLGRNWKEIAEYEGLWPPRQRKTLDHVTRTLKRKEDHFSALLWRSLPPEWKTGGSIDQAAIGNERALRLICSSVGLPYREAPEGCKKLILALALRGQDADAQEFIQLFHRLEKKKKK